MGKFILTAVFAILTVSPARAEVPDYYQVLPLSVTEVSPTPEEIYSDYIQSFGAPPSPVAIDWSTLMLIGEKVIQLIKDGQPVVNVKRDSVSVVPVGVRGWQELNGWQPPVTKVYSVTAKNKMNMTVLDLRLKVSAMYGGGMDGRGKFLANVIVVPTTVFVRWGFHCDVWSESREPVNMGTAKSPVAGLGFDIRYRFGSPFSEENSAQDYFITGLGEIKEVR
ncbi:MAG TPA: hypothetical protein VIH99_12300 [Bdellovibrionota bacterium]